MDVFDKKKRSAIMSAVKGKDTKPEILVRSIVHRLGYRFRKNKRDLPGNPDIALCSRRKVILVHGCFWHGHKGCKRSALPQTNKSFWIKKIHGNAVRDQVNKRKLKRMGWQVMTIWQCQAKDLEKLGKRIQSFIKE